MTWIKKLLGIKPKPKPILQIPEIQARLAGIQEQIEGQTKVIDRHLKTAETLDYDYLYDRRQVIYHLQQEQMKWREELRRTIPIQIKSLEGWIYSYENAKKDYQGKLKEAGHTTEEYESFNQFIWQMDANIAKNEWEINQLKNIRI